jgi:hypothetical protein
MLGLTGGELFVIAFVVITVVSAPWWPRLGAALMTRLMGVPAENGERASAAPEAPSEGRSDR